MNITHLTNFELDLKINHKNVNYKMPIRNHKLLRPEKYTKISWDAIILKEKKN